MYTHSVLTNSPVITLIPRTASLRRRVIDALQEAGYCIAYDRNRDFLCSTKNIVVTSGALLTALTRANISQV
jgi:hypothetical protein